MSRGVVDEHVADPERREVLEVEHDRRDRPAGIRLDVDRRLDVVTPRSGEHEREALVLRGAAAPPRDHGLVDAGGGDLRHLLVDDCRVGARIGPARREEA